MLVSMAIGGLALGGVTLLLSLCFSMVLKLFAAITALDIMVFLCGVCVVTNAFSLDFLVGEIKSL
jgi:hypothetical protein